MLHFKPQLWPFYIASTSWRHSVPLYLVLTAKLHCGKKICLACNFASKAPHCQRIKVILLKVCFYSSFFIWQGLQNWMLTESIERWHITFMLSIKGLTTDKGVTTCIKLTPTWSGTSINGFWQTVPVPFFVFNRLYKNRRSIFNLLSKRQFIRYI